MELLKKTNSCYMGTFHRFLYSTHTLLLPSGQAPGMGTQHCSQVSLFLKCISPQCYHHPANTRKKVHRCNFCYTKQRRFIMSKH